MDVIEGQFIARQAGAFNSQSCIGTFLIAGIVNRTPRIANCKKSNEADEYLFSFRQLGYFLLILKFHLLIDFIFGIDDQTVI